MPLNTAHKLLILDHLLLRELPRIKIFLVIHRRIRYQQCLVVGTREPVGVLRGAFEGNLEVLRHVWRHLEHRLHLVLGSGLDVALGCYTEVVRGSLIFVGDFLQHGTNILLNALILLLINAQRIPLNLTTITSTVSTILLLALLNLFHPILWLLFLLQLHFLPLIQFTLNLIFLQSLCLLGEVNGRILILGSLWCIRFQNG